VNRAGGREPHCEPGKGKWLEVATRKTRVTKTTTTVIIDQGRLTTLLRETGLDISGNVLFEVVGIPYQQEWGLEANGEDGVHIRATWTTTEEAKVEGP